MDQPLFIYIVPKPILLSLNNIEFWNNRVGETKPSNLYYVTKSFNNYRIVCFNKRGKIKKREGIYDTFIFYLVERK